MVAPTEQPMATFFLVGVPSIGCQAATSSRWGSRTGGCRSVMVTSSGRVGVRSPGLPTVDSQLPTRVGGTRHGVKGHFLRSASAQVSAGDGGAGAAHQDSADPAGSCPGSASGGFSYG